MAKLTQEEILSYLEEATILELNDLVSAIEVTVTLTDVGGTKVAVIKAVREITGLGLVDAKKLVDGVPAAIKENVSPEEAESIKEKLVAAGATVEIK